MARTFIRQDTQIRNSDLYDDTVAAGSTLETAPANVEDDLNSLRSQMKRALWADVAGNWYDDIPTYNSKKRGIAKVNEDLDDIEEKRLLFRSQVIVSGGISVPATQNYVVLSVASSETPSETAAVGAVTTEGAVVAQHGGTFGTHALDEVSGQNAITPKNLCVIVDQVTGDPILSSGRTVWGLLQSEVGTDGHTFNDTDQQVQISFVRRTATGDDLEACPVADIESEDIDYSYVRRIAFDSVPETAFLLGAFVDQAGAVNVTRQNAYDNQSTTPVEVTNNAILDLNSAGIYWEIRDLANATLFRITEGSTGGTSEILIGSDVDEFDVDAIVVDFAQGVTINSAGTSIEIGKTAGLINTTGTDNLEIQAGGELFFDDGNRAGSTWSVPLKFTESSTEWDDLETEYGEVSLAAMLIEAKNPGNARGTKVYANVTVDTDADTDVGGTGGGSNLDAQLPNMSTGTFITAYDVYLNGELLRGGADAAANNDYYPGTSLLLGQLKFEFKVKQDDVLCVIPYNI
jgi:hypothetical protein